MITLEPGSTNLQTLEHLYREGFAAILDPAVRSQVDDAHALVMRASTGEKAVYGVNTGFGKLANRKINAEDTATLQRNLILSHCCGLGSILPIPETRLMMALKILSLGRGASGVRWEVIELLQGLLRKNVTPVIPSQGSVGASGDLAPLAHMTAVLIGEGEAFYDDQKLAARDALDRAGLRPITLGPKEGLALINGTQFSTANVLAGLFNVRRLAQSALVVSALSTDAIMGSTAPLNAEVHRLRGHRGQIEVSDLMVSIMQGSEIRESHHDEDSRVQDPYCIRCQPQVLGAALDVMRMAAASMEIEANAVTDNPLVLTESQEIVSGGNFHAEPVGFAADMIALAIAEIGSIAQRRVALMVDPTLSFDLPPFLTPDPGLNSGFMVAEVTTAALMSENKHLANPCVTDSTPTSANQEDHVSMAAHGAVRLHRMNENLGHIIAIEMLCAAQGIEARSPLKTSNALQRVVSRLRKDVPPLREDRILAPEIEKTRDLIETSELSDLVDVKLVL